MGLSIVTIANCDPHILEHTLESIMEQEYQGDYEVIVVRPMKKGETLNMLELLMNRYDRIRTTYRPDEPKYITDCEVDIMLGVKAAQYDNIVMIPAEFTLPSETWLNDVAEMTDDMSSQHMFIGNAAYPEKTGFIAKRNHKNIVGRALKEWCKSRGFSRSDMKLKKEQQKLFIIAFSQKEYINEHLLRNVIFKQIDA